MASRKKLPLIYTNTVGLGRNGKRPPAKLRDVLRQAWKDYQENGGVSHERFWQELANETSKR
jgi:hypothetical protein